MTDAPLEERILVLVPTAKDGERTGRMLGSARLSFAICHDMRDVCRELTKGAAAVLLAEEAIETDREGCLEKTLREQSPWSDVPLIVMARQNGRSHRIQESMNATLVERPVRVRSLLSVVREALRSRRHQYAVRDHIVRREKAEEALRESDRKKDDFIALLAHELRNPLAPIRNGLQVLTLAGDNAETTAQTRNMMERQLGHMVRLIDDLLDVSRISRDKMELRRERVLLSDIVNTAVETARPAIEAGSHELNISLPQRPVHLDADLTRIAQVLSNLLTNSAKYTERGGRIWISAERHGPSLALAVKDTGIGIPARSLGTIFDMFSQVDRSIERETGGLGIGLALVKGLVEMHGGTVTAASEGAGKGSTFTVTLPVLADQEENTPSAPEPSRTKTPGSRILVVDDNRDGAESLTLMLKLLGNDVETAHDGIEAVECAERFQPEVILMDVGMPQLNGYEATRRIREHPWGKNISIIALTGWGQENDRQLSYQAGCDGHLVKPVNPSDLERILAEGRGRGRGHRAEQALER